MFTRLRSWIVTHKLASIIVGVLLVFLLPTLLSFVSLFTGLNTQRMPAFSEQDSYSPGAPSGVGMMQKAAPMESFGSISREPAPVTGVSRMVVQNSHLSLVVTQVSEAMQQIKSHVASLGGYMVEGNLNNPQDAASGTITVRIPQEKLDATLDYFRKLSVKVVSENLQGTDVTDQYQDTEERLRILDRNKARLEEIMGQGTEISDILQIQQQIFSVQDQIDTLKGQQQYLKQTSSLAKVTLFLSTDEYALPYAPAESWRPEVIFKEAVRSLIRNLRGIGTLLIWLAVYAVFWGPIALLVLYLRRRNKIKRPTSSS